MKGLFAGNSGASLEQEIVASAISGGWKVTEYVQTKKPVAIAMVVADTEITAVLILLIIFNLPQSKILFLMGR